MSPINDVRAANFAFFQHELWQPGGALEESMNSGLLHPQSLSALPNQYPFELTLWLRVGASLGFFDHQQAVTFLLTLDKQLNKNWHVLSTIDAESLSGPFYDFLTIEGSSVTLDATVFLSAEALYRAQDEPLHSMFRSHLLLTSELMGDPDAVFFQEAVRWAPDEVWKKIVNSSRLWTGSFQAISRGFARTLVYLESAAAVPPPDDDPFLDGVMRNAAIKSIPKFRLGVKDLNRTVPRYFQLAGSLLGRSVPLGPPSLDEPRAVFSALSALMEDWADLRGTGTEGQHEENWWKVFRPALETTAAHEQSIYPYRAENRSPGTFSPE